MEISEKERHNIELLIARYAPREIRYPALVKAAELAKTQLEGFREAVDSYYSEKYEKMTPEERMAVLERLIAEKEAVLRALESFKRDLVTAH